MRISGLDLSLTSTGAAHLDGPETGLAVASVARLKPPAKLGTHERLDWLLHRVWEQVQHSGWVVMEGPSFGSPNAQHKMGGLWWCVAHMLWLRHIPYDVVQPATLKVYATGKGRVEKDEVLAETIRRYPGADIHGNDQADALVLAAMGAAYLGWPYAQLPKEHTRALASVTWSAWAQNLREAVTWSGKESGS